MVSAVGADGVALGVADGVGLGETLGVVDPAGEGDGVGDGAGDGDAPGFGDTDALALAVGDGVGGPSALAGDAKNQPLSARAVAAATGIRIRTVATEIASPR